MQNFPKKAKEKNFGVSFFAKTENLPQALLKKVLEVSEIDRKLWGPILNDKTFFDRTTFDEIRICFGTFMFTEIESTKFARVASGRHSSKTIGRYGYEIYHELN